MTKTAVAVPGPRNAHAAFMQAASSLLEQPSVVARTQARRAAIQGEAEQLLADFYRNYAVLHVDARDFAVTIETEAGVTVRVSGTPSGDPVVTIIRADGQTTRVAPSSRAVTYTATEG